MLKTDVFVWLTVNWSMVKSYSGLFCNLYNSLCNSLVVATIKFFNLSEKKSFSQTFKNTNCRKRFFSWHACCRCNLLCWMFLLYDITDTILFAKVSLYVMISFYWYSITLIESMWCSYSAWHQQEQHIVRDSKVPELGFLTRVNILVLFYLFYFLLFCLFFWGFFIFCVSH